ncbi:MAG: phosphoribosylaminoimidazolesuccinocarboxamide synthase [Deltaproteobacteria bacterium CG12_big_fil_rev_8_21_14_0_65_43_10]|nr:MAG: phosphoribosylaminoimidazolesuccinocarboxamide synthase [Deltaproteobacteria bacterium CG2_30_43_15]PIQ46757.1 MAG: phosphoribosylaminoimidazolesuccinocarboxamide synthase [Deltaproteobacteria bacterium CG12_big_fil_rev_8_21_14_0_65_43_10]PIU84749.1 MAG: phosphoribosylaminoimidazolesuccinocarboxamide synthase [Deltaproteobacteria bacterium CG06_land_8_20_14_3_00_44_19]PIX22692.1 MAG: phosphoribosylaminoimidazolesuccinocarboxamide synthase [Deltaproteobacteria bacterium CG_4_8_14_3_um_fil
MTGGVTIETDLKGLKLLGRGKVRDIYDLGEHLLIVATDRISAFDVIMQNGIPDKGKTLTQISKYWFEVMKDIVPNHLVSVNVRDFPQECRKYKDILEGRSMLVKKARPLPVECVVRGYLAGSAWEEYKQGGTVCSIKLPPGFLESSKLDEPIFTPSTKAEMGHHDENITIQEMKEIIGDKLADEVIGISLEIYKKGCMVAEEKGIIIADTKFEFGIYNDGLILIDELLTPDSSRFWPKNEYKPGRAQKSFDKQFLRDYLLSLNWDKSLPPPELPEDIIEKTREKYLEALKRLVV